MSDTTTDKSASTRTPHDDRIDALIAAATTYGVIADWFESRSIAWRDWREERETELARMDLFNAVEADLRVAARAVVRHNGNRSALFIKAVERHATKIGEPAKTANITPEDAAIIDRVKGDEVPLAELDQLYWKCKCSEARKAVVDAMRRKYSRR